MPACQIPRRRPLGPLDRTGSEKEDDFAEERACGPPEEDERTAVDNSGKTLREKRFSEMKNHLILNGCRINWRKAGEDFVSINPV